MSKFGWDLPPGCTQRHIDEAFGGGPEAEAAEAFADLFFEKYKELLDERGQLSEEMLSALVEWCWSKIGEAYAMGYQSGASDERAAREMLEEGEQ